MELVKNENLRTVLDRRTRRGRNDRVGLLGRNRCTNSFELGDVGMILHQCHPRLPHSIVARAITTYQRSSKGSREFTLSTSARTNQHVRVHWCIDCSTKFANRIVLADDIGPEFNSSEFRRQRRVVGA